jgi:coenzyme PQQ synthesis protein D (PqqD)
VRWRRSPGALWRVAPGYLVVGTPGGRILEVDGPGGELWQLLTGWVEEDDLAAILAGRYEADENVVSRDVRFLLSELSAQGYVDGAD